MKPETLKRLKKESSRPVPKLRTGEVLSERTPKVIPVGKTNKEILVRRVKYSARDTEMLFHTLAHAAALVDAHWELRGTEFFSHSMLRELDKLKIKSRPLFAQNDATLMNDTVIEQAAAFSRFCKVSYELSLQPETIQKRFAREYNDLLISCGINTK